MRFEAFRLEDWDVVVYWLPYFLVLCGAAALLSILVLALMCRALGRLRWRLAAVCEELGRVERALRDLPPRHTAFDEFVEREDDGQPVLFYDDDQELEAGWHDLVSNLSQGSR